ncbi:MULTISPECIES: thioredoxin-like domain-containing protein [unclassified Lentimicrobium]|uniref:thioredoxin-like domain-containing protein n=1 Tax=unclassified Lentimicrobium TaxID=2677434 RepID=UPI001551FE3F|nr:MULTISPECIES: thioredoxin-like domain-containing protein [unclassified Lentimicrobium]NPD47919.1 redoxin domain-containing protein [Lentimicrobium sp. S6]NPD84470.1 redoxin domain-containing protein [Lentimicrobium sp. L6]
MRILTFTLFLLINLSSFGQCQIIGHIKDVKDSTYLYLQENRGGKYHTIDSCLLDKQGKYEFGGQFATGYYSLMLEPDNWVQFIISPNEDFIQIDFSSPQLRNHLEVTKSNNNIELWNFIRFRNLIKSKISENSIEKSYAAKENIELTHFENIEDSLNLGYHQFLIKTYQEKPTSFFAKTIISDIEIDQKEDFFKYTFFEDAELIRSGVLTHQVMKYLQFHTDYTEDGFIQSVDEILEQASVNHEVYEFILNYLLELFNEVGPDVVLDYLVEHYVIGDACSDMTYSDALNAKLIAYKNLQIGKKVANVSIFNHEGIMMNLYDLCSFSKLNILFFGSSACHFCQEAIPQLKELIQEPSNKDIKIIYISLDTEAEAWLSPIPKDTQQWVYLSELKGWDSKSAEIYQVHKTPSYYLLDANANILSKPRSVDELQKDMDFLNKK